MSRRLKLVPPIDDTALERAYARLREHADAAQAAVHAMLGEVVRALSPDERKRFFEAALKRRDRKRDVP